jgi:hypothetical protein
LQALHQRGGTVANADDRDANLVSFCHVVLLLMICGQTSPAPRSLPNPYTVNGRPGVQF